MSRKTSKALLVLCTASRKAEAKKIALVLVKERLAACVSLVPQIESHFRWEGKIQSSREVMLVIKTTTARYSALEKRIRSLHSYDVPEIIALPILAGNPAYLKWIQAETSR